MKVTVPFVDLDSLHAEIAAELEAAVMRTVGSGRYLLGPELERFEHEFAAYCESRHCVGVGSGLSAIELALRAAGIGPGDEVVVPAYTFVATWLAVTRTGAQPVGVDVDAATYNIDPRLAEEAISARTAAIVPVHLRGEPADMEAISELARAHGLLVVEDAAQAHGARHRGRRVGGLGDAAAFSFYPSKNLGALGDGGAVTTDDAALAEKLRLLRNYGMRDRYRFELAGTNSRLAEIQAAALRVKLGHLDRWNAARARFAEAYRERLGAEASIELPVVPDWAEPVWHLFVVGLARRDACSRALGERGIETLVHYPLLPHMTAPYAGGETGRFPVAERLAAASLSLPLHPRLGVERAQLVSGALLAAARNSS
jgi:dTDP-3-amino-3,4,6-trideoxy-alpha-D-glucose transaminase